MTDLPVLVHWTDFLSFTGILFLVLLVRYFLSAGAFYLHYYILKGEKYASQRLSSYRNQPDQTKKEIVYSVKSSLVFALIGTGTYWLWQEGYTNIYTDIHTFPLWYLPVSFLIYSLLHETYYYWVHRAMHHRLLYRRVHRAHHSSIVPSPWTAFSFHPWEALIESLVLPALLLVVPIHPIVLGGYLLLMTISSVINHLDIEVYPAFLQRSWIGKLLIGATHHHYHHSEFQTNYGLYYTFWDQWMGTESEKMKRK